MKIVHVANFGLQPKTMFQHGFCSKITNGLIRNGHVVCLFSSRDVAREASIFNNHKFGGVNAANKALLEYCDYIQPDVLLLGHADVIKPKTLVMIRRNLPAIKILQWSADALFVAANVTHLCSKFDVVDATLVTTAGEPLRQLAKQTHSKVAFFPNIVDFSVENGRNHEKELPFDLFYSCAAPAGPRYTCGEYWLPEQIIQRLEGDIPGVRLLLAGLRGSSRLVGAEYQSALESAAIGLNLSARNDHPLYSSDRLAHLCGNGLAILMDRATGYDQLFSDDEFAFYSSIDELVDKTRRLIMDVSYRQGLAKAGRSRYHELFNEKIVSNYMLEVACGTLEPTNYPWPTLAN